MSSDEPGHDEDAKGDVAGVVIAEVAEEFGELDICQVSVGLR